MPAWSFLTNHARVLLVIAGNPDIRLREIAATVGISERRAHGLVTDLAASGYLTKKRDGRRNTYEIQSERPLEDDLTQPRPIGEILDLLSDTRDAEQEHAGTAPSARDGARAAATSHDT